MALLWTAPHPSGALARREGGAAGVRSFAGVRRSLLPVCSRQFALAQQQHCWLAVPSQRLARVSHLAYAGFDWLPFDKPKAARPPSECEHSMLVHEECVLFIFQLDLDTQLQRCLNYEAYKAAQEVRRKRELVDEAIQSMKERKANNSGSPVQSLSVTDFASEGLKLRMEMQRAVEDERYAEAARIRDLLKELEVESKRMQALMAEWGTNKPPVLRLGQRVMHKKFGYRGIVVGWDSQCCETEEWSKTAHIDELKRGMQQPFYHLLVDVRDWEYDSSLPPVAYVAEELLDAPELDQDSGNDVNGAGGSASSSSSSSSSGGAQGSSGGGQSWVEVHGPDPMQHPYTYILFLGQDARGDYLPCRQLRDKYNAKRRDVYPPGQDGTTPFPGFSSVDDGDSDGDGDGSRGRL